VIEKKYTKYHINIIKNRGISKKKDKNATLNHKKRGYNGKNITISLQIIKNCIILQ